MAKHDRIIALLSLACSTQSEGERNAAIKQAARRMRDQGLTMQDLLSTPTPQRILGFDVVVAQQAYNHGYRAGTAAMTEQLKDKIMFKPTTYVGKVLASRWTWMVFGFCLAIVAGTH